MITWIKRLEGKPHVARQMELKTILSELNVPFTIDSFKINFKKELGENIFVDINPGTLLKRTVLSAHYDAWGNSPGANDNATGTAVLIDLILKLKQERNPTKNCRFIFFDYEETIWPWRTGSAHYIKKFGIRDLDCVYNLDAVGVGDLVFLWNIKETQLKQDYLRSLAEFIKGEFPIEYLTKTPWYFKSEHLEFQQAGFDRVCTITCLHKEDAIYKNKFENQKIRFAFSFLFAQLTGRGKLPRLLINYHNHRDHSGWLNENTLVKISDILHKTIQTNDHPYS